ncbi:MAG TPA: 3-hydroxyacyl-CoA dehydrogenase/enoyl-CoA hydratase family protein [Polyangia bacterium]|nr:3-hydroxyacyl-CoA dehydrogenase/enoyl-CoA hydratase family protein [Polyangia bacterium]
MTTTEPVNEVTVLGAGVMGAAIAAHLANAGLRVRLLDIPPKDAPAPGADASSKRARNKISDAGLEGARKAKPAAFFSPRFETLVTTGNLEDDLAEAVASSDFIIEAVIENLAIKQRLYARIDELGGRAIVTSNTSGLRIAELMQGRSDSFKRRFCITHFFNPPRYLELVEIVAGPETAAETIARAEALCGRLLGKGLVRAKDTPNFIANRIGTFAMMRTLAVAVEQGYTVEEVDMVFGPATGKPKSGVFRTADVVGLDTLTHVTKNCFDALVNDERRAVFDPPPVLKALVDKKWLGSKTKQGFYKKVGDAILQLDLKTMEYGPQQKPRFASIGAARGAEDVDEKLRRVLGGDDRAAALARTVTYETLIYAANRLGEIADDIVDIDRALRWGFGWERGPFEMWDALGVKATAAKMEAAGLTVPGWVKEQIAAQGEGMRFYKSDKPGTTLELGQRGGFTPVSSDPRHLSLDAVRAAGREVERNGSASILDLGDGVFCLEFHAKMNALDPEIVALMTKAVDRAEREGVGLVIGNDAPDAFCAGANLFSLMVALGQNNTQAIDDMVVGFQSACQRTRYARVPVVAAPFGLALGGGAEVVLGCQNVRAAAELYIGCVEVGVGLIPAGGGCMELAARASAKATDDPNFDLLSLVRVPFEMLARARVSISAEDARDLGYLKESHGVSMARQTVIADAKELVLGLARAGYRPPPPRRVRVIGEAGAATMRSLLRNLVGAHQISEHDAKISGQLARILSGGDVPAGATVSEQHLLDLEREAFLSLCGEPKTRERIQHMLTTSKPLRN